MFIEEISIKMHVCEQNDTGNTTSSCNTMQSLVIISTCVTPTAYLVNTNFFISHQWYRLLSTDQSGNELGQVLHKWFMYFFKLSIVNKEESWNDR